MPAVYSVYFQRRKTKSVDSIGCQLDSNLIATSPNVFHLNLRRQAGSSIENDGTYFFQNNRNLRVCRSICSPTGTRHEFQQYQRFHRFEVSLQAPPNFGAGFMRI